MNKKLLLFLLIPFLGFSQVQIGQDIDGVFFNELSGTSVSLSASGNIIAIGSDYNDGNGIVRIFENTGHVWTQIGTDIDGDAQGDYSGNSVSLSADGSFVAIGAPGNDANGTYSGHVRIFENISGVWTKVGSDINGVTAGDWCGISVSLSDNGNIVAVGAHSNDGNGTFSGHVRVFENISGTWTQIGNDIFGDSAGDMSGTSVSISSDGNVIAIGTPQNSGNLTKSGYVKVYKNVSGIWTQIGSKIQGEGSGDKFGSSVSLSDNGNIVAIGAPYNDANAINSGRVKIYENISNTWFQIGIIDGISTNDENGNSVSLSGDGNIVVVGATQDIYGSQYTKKGYVRIFKNISGIWTQIGQTIQGEAIGDYSAKSVSISSDSSTLAIGAPYNNGNNASGHVRVYDISGILSNNEFVSENFNIYPNPTSDVLNITLENNLVLQELTIYNNLGQVVKTATESVIDVSHLAKGLYFVEVTTNQGKATKKVVVK